MKNSLANFSKEQKLNKIFQDRFSGSSAWAKKYCRDEFIPTKQAFMTSKNYSDPNRTRYTMLNFCYGLHKTVEIRVFTAHMPLRRAVNCLLWYISTVSSFLEENFDKMCNSDLTKDIISFEDSDFPVVEQSNDNDVVMADEFDLVFEPGS